MRRRRFAAEVSWAVAIEGRAETASTPARAARSIMVIDSLQSESRSSRPERRIPFLEVFRIRSIGQVFRESDRGTVELLQAVPEHRTITLFQDVPPDLNPESRRDPKD